MSGNDMTGAEALVRLLQHHGVSHIFGLCGDTSLPFYDALHRLDHGMTHILTRDERCAAYMADGYARISGKVGVCEGPSGGGATYIAPGLIEANDSSVTTGRPGSAHLCLPYDVQKAAVDPQDIWAQPELSRYPAWRSGGDPLAVEAALDALLAAKNPVVICGGGVVLSGAEGELDKLATRLNLTVATTISGQGSLADSHPNCLGVVGSNGGVPATRQVVEEADLVVFLGCRAGSVTTERWRFPGPGVPAVHFDSDPQVISAAYQTAVAVVGDLQLSLSALNRLLAENQDLTADFGGRTRVAAAKQEKFSAFNALAASSQTPIRPERVVRELNRLLPSDSIIVADPGTPCPYFAGFYNFDQPGRRFISNRAHGALGYSLSAAMGAHYARPGAKTVAVMGDGSFGFTAGELETVARKQLPITFLVFSNAVYVWIKAGQKTGFEERYFSVDFSRTDHAAVAAAYGIKSWRVEDPDDLPRVLAAATEHAGPTLVDVIAQPLQDAQAPVSEWIA